MVVSLVCRGIPKAEVTPQIDDLFSTIKEFGNEIHCFTGRKRHENQIARARCIRRIFGIDRINTAVKPRIDICNPPSCRRIGKQPVDLNTRMTQEKLRQFHAGIARSTNNRNAERIVQQYCLLRRMHNYTIFRINMQTKNTGGQKKVPAERGDSRGPQGGARNRLPASACPGQRCQAYSSCLASLSWWENRLSLSPGL